MICRCDAPALPTTSLEFPDTSVQDPNAAESPQALLWRAQGATVRLLRKLKIAKTLVIRTR